MALTIHPYVYCSAPFINTGWFNWFVDTGTFQTSSVVDYSTITSFDYAQCFGLCHYAYCCTDLEIKMQSSPDGFSSWTDVPGATVTIPWAGPSEVRFVVTGEPTSGHKYFRMFVVAGLGYMGQATIIVASR